MPMTPYDFIQRKRLNKGAEPEEVKEFIRSFLEGSVADYQMSAWLMAVCFNGLSEAELLAYTEALIESGERFDLSSIPGFKVDKHSTGGVGDKVSLVLAPLVASCGVVVPMVSGRGLGHTGGTLDKLASIPGFCTDLSVDEFKRYLSKIGVAMIGQSADLCPADGRIYALRDVTATVASIPLIAASISSKKIAEGAQGLVLDTKVGSGAFMKSVEDGEQLAATIIALTHRFAVRTTALLTDMSQPLGRAVGNALEVAEAIDCLKGQGPDDLRKIVLELAAEMLVLAGRKDRVEARKRAEDALERGRALAKFIEMVRMQAGDVRIVDDPTLLPQATRKIKASSEHSGFVQSINAYQIGMLGVELGAGRRRKEEGIDPAVGFTIHKKIGDEVHVGEVLATVHANDESKGLKVASGLTECFEIGDEAITPPRLIIKRIT